jgi:hypothetical protein
MPDVLMVTTTVGMLHGVHGHTSHLEEGEGREGGREGDREGW